MSSDSFSSLDIDDVSELERAVIRGADTVDNHANVDDVDVDDGDVEVGEEEEEVDDDDDDGEEEEEDDDEQWLHAEAEETAALEAHLAAAKAAAAGRSAAGDAGEPSVAAVDDLDSDVLLDEIGDLDASKHENLERDKEEAEEEDDDEDAAAFAKLVDALPDLPPSVVDYGAMSDAVSESTASLLGATRGSRADRLRAVDAALELITEIALGRCYKF